MTKRISGNIINKFGIVSLVLLTTSGCSYGYDIFSFNRNGALYFSLVEQRKLPMPLFGMDANCIKQIVVEAADSKRVQHTWPDGSVTFSYPGIIVWNVINKNDECLFKFPVRYGQVTSNGLVVVAPKSLQPGVIYDVNVTSSGSGYGGLKFKIENTPSSFDLPNGKN
jgi:hypothetical protein